MIDLNPENLSKSFLLYVPETYQHKIGIGLLRTDRKKITKPFMRAHIFHPFDNIKTQKERAL